MIPTLAFNDGASVIATDIVAHAQVVCTILPKVNAYESINENGIFNLKMSYVKINGLHLMAYAQTKVSFEREDCDGLDLMIPLDGCNYTFANDTKYQFNANQNAFLAACEKRHSFVGGCGVIIRLDAKRIKETCSAMSGYGHRAKIAFETRTPLLQRGDINFSVLFKSVFNQIDAVGESTEFLNNLAIDDSLYRLIVGLLQDDAFFANDASNRRRPQARTEVAKLCEWLSANLNEAVSLTEMERRTGLSARVLQYSFQKAFGLSPKHWLRKQRLHAARAVLLKLTEEITITSLAYDFCFSSPSEFAQYYRTPTPWAALL